MDEGELNPFPVNDGCPMDAVFDEKGIYAEVKPLEDGKSKLKGEVEVQVLPVHSSSDFLSSTPLVDTPSSPHTPPPPVAWKIRQREIVQVWPRAPTGKDLSFSDLSKYHTEGSPNHFPWAASIQHIYTVESAPGSSNKWISTGSAIARWMKENGEAEFAIDELSLTTSQELPRMIPVFPHDKILALEEAAIRNRGSNSGIPMNPQGDVKDDGSAPQAPSTRWPWPLVPFSYRTQKLRTRISHENLPKKLIVHDPWNALEVRSYYGKAIPHNAEPEWTSTQKDSTLVYKLKLRSERATAAEDSKPVDDATESFIVRVSPKSQSGGQTPFLVRVLHDSPPTSNTSQEAHLYISPAKFLGSGHHSSVYTCEWEIPRSLLSPHERFTLCKNCVIEDIRGRLEVRRRSERLEKKQKSRKRSETSLTESELVTIEECEEGSDDIDILSIRTTVLWQETSRPNCSHLKGTLYVPEMARVRVAAKLSFEGDKHLKQEARNYQAFDSHFFEHWSGLNVVPGIKDPVPVGPIVPQFYGYYVPEDVSIYEGYRSPILLLEDCGVKVDVTQLTLDQRHEAASLFRRFMAAGWVHGSVYDRNIVMQKGPLNELLGTHPLSLEENSLSFRVIDFGRSYHKRNDVSDTFKRDQDYDKVEVGDLFGIY
ncbi:hypothetical protein C0995_013325 [Termitomyces sp. Mi166|nr:hypothetical protein C0995_013325 [Termitomyces sp. Mi166\